MRKLGVTQELLSLVTGLAHYLKLLIRISLQGALRFERERRNVEGLHQFLDELDDLDAMKEAEMSLDLTEGTIGLSDQSSDECMTCNVRIEDECVHANDRRWHLKCISCSSCLQDLSKRLGDAAWSERDRRVLCRDCASHASDAVMEIRHVTRLQQYVFLLRVALARLLTMLRSGGTLPHTSGKELPSRSWHPTNLLV